MEIGQEIKVLGQDLRQNRSCHGDKGIPGVIAMLAEEE
jgi:hypothetical protein